ncbi:carbonic anhydrase [Hyaloraphidium curvatum]|nr:carbonic anhydrase [Hyaloraphidium curvatum]
MGIVDEVEAANAKYAADFGDKGKLALPPARKLCILTCMDARIDPAKAFGVAEGDAHVIRNAGGRASDDAIRSIVISHKLLGTQQVVLAQHEDCGMLYFDNSTMAGLLEKSLDSVEIVAGPAFKDVGAGPGSKEGNYINWLTIPGDLKQSVRNDIDRIKNHPLFDKKVPIAGYVYDVTTGKLIKVE